MKKLWMAFFALLLLLTGCAAQDVPEDAQTDPSTAETLPAGYYVPGSAFEVESAGALRQYDLPGVYSNISAIGDQLLITALTQDPNLTVLTGEECIPTAEIVLPAENGKALYNGYTYYEGETKQVVFLDAQLLESTREQLPAEIVGEPLVSPDGEEIFYCVGKNIYALEVERKISRLVKTHSYETLSLDACYFDGALISCLVDEGKTIYVSTETGQTMYEKNDVEKLYTYENQYLAIRTDGTVLQRIVGTRDTDAKLLNVQQTDVAGAMELGGYLGWSVDENNALALSFYDAATGKMTASQKIADVGAPISIYADRWNNCIWLLLRDGKLLLRWKVSASAETEETSYLGEIYTSEVPDKKSLELCEERAKTFNKSNGVYVRVWERAVEHPGPYTLEAEYQPEAIHSLLDDLLPILREFPSKFLSKSAKEKIRICLVRSIDGKQQAVQFWDGKYPYIIITAGIDLRSEFMRCMGYIVDSHVLGNSPDYDYWPGLNPEGFVYGAEDQNLEYLTGENQYFTSENAMKTPVEDRTEIFHQAMLPDNAEMFQSAAMQKKLVTLCKAIRDAWGLKKNKDILPWEQYLQTPIAYKK